MVLPSTTSAALLQLSLIYGRKIYKLSLIYQGEGESGNSGHQTRGRHVPGTGQRVALQETTKCAEKTRFPAENPCRHEESTQDESGTQAD